MSALTDLTTAVSNIEASIAAAIALIQAGAGDATELAALQQRLATAQGSLDAAVAAAKPPTT